MTRGQLLVSLVLDNTHTLLRKNLYLFRHEAAFFKGGVYRKVFKVVFFC